MKLIYFSWIRERLGIPGENVEPPQGVDTVGKLLEWLTQRSEDYANVLEHQSVVRIAVDKHHVDDMATPISQNSEIALFPPMTGG